MEEPSPTSAVHPTSVPMQHSQSVGPGPLDTTPQAHRFPMPKRLSVTIVDWLNRRPSRSPRAFQSLGARSRPTSWIIHIMSHLFSLLWLLPVITLLIFNFGRYVIGPSIWCPNNSCSADLWMPNMIAGALNLDKNDHNMLGILQFLAKILEIWFGISAMLFIYDVVMVIARMEGGMPLGYLLLHLEFRDIRHIFRPELWTAPFPRAEATPSQKRRKSVSTLFVVAILAACVTIIVNLMDPALAILMLPVLQWVNSSPVPQEIFFVLNAATSPEAGGHILKGCGGLQLHANNYSCTQSYYGPGLDSLAAWSNATFTNAQQANGDEMPGFLQEDLVSFGFNTTANESVIWSPNRQVMHSISAEYEAMIDPTHANYGIANLNESLQIVYNRQGPTIGFKPTINFGEKTVIVVSDNKEVHCYTGWSAPNSQGTFTKCFGVGIAWDTANIQTSFFIGNGPDLELNKTAVDVFFADRATFFNDNQDFGTGIRPCLHNDTAPSCDWDSIFDSSKLPANLAHLAGNNLVTAYSIPIVNPYDEGEEEYEDEAYNGAKDTQARVYSDVVATLGIATYSLDISPENIMNFVRVQGYGHGSNGGEPMVVDPDWILAGWSVNTEGTVDFMRPIAQQVSAALATTDWDNADAMHWDRISYLHYSIVGQSLSMIDYEAGAARPVDESQSAFTKTFLRAIRINPSDDVVTAADAASSGILYGWATRRVWMYDINGSVTTGFAAGIALAGSICVLLRFILGVFAPRKSVSSIELLAAALDYHHVEPPSSHHHRKGSSGGNSANGNGGPRKKSEFAGLEGQQRQIAKIRYHLHEESDDEADDDDQHIDPISPLQRKSDVLGSVSMHRRHSKFSPVVS